MSTPAGSDKHGDIPVSIVVAVTVLIIAVLGSVVYLTAQGREVSNVLLVLSSLIAPTIASFVAIRRLADVNDKVTGVQSQVSGVQDQVSGVQDQVSGVQSKVGERVDNLIADKSHLEAQAAAAGLIPITAKVSFDPESTGPMPRVPTDTAPAPAINPARISVNEILNRESGQGNG